MPTTTRRIKRMKPITIAACLLVTAPFAVGAPLTYDCSYTSHSNDKGLKNDSQPFNIKFLVDAEAKKAYIVGNQGSADVIPIPGWEGISFIEITDSGNVMTTTIVTEGTATAMPSVHSRHTTMTGTGRITPSQYYGTCKPQI
jgi:uncharacterized protein YuzE